jgi:hypothetical protein
MRQEIQVSDEAGEPLASDPEIQAALQDYLSRQTLGTSYLLDPAQAVAMLHEPALDPEVRDALLDQLNAWIRLADFAKWLSIGLAIGSGVITAFLIYAMTWNDLFAGSGLWEFSLLFFALAVFVASPLAIFVVGRPLKGIDEWAPTLSMAGETGSANK